MAGCWHLSGSCGSYLFGWGTAPWKVSASVLLGELSSSARTAVEISTDGVFIAEARVGKRQKSISNGEGFTHSFYAQLLRTHYAPNARHSKSLTSAVLRSIYLLFNFLTRNRCQVTLLLLLFLPPLQWRYEWHTEGFSKLSWASDRQQNTPPQKRKLCLAEEEKQLNFKTLSMQINRLFNSTEGKHNTSVFVGTKWPRTDWALPVGTWVDTHQNVINNICHATVK